MCQGFNLHCQNGHGILTAATSNGLDRGLLERSYGQKQVGAWLIGMILALYVLLPLRRSHGDETYHFVHSPAQRGSCTAQTVELDFRVLSTIRQRDQLVHSTEREVRHRQYRVVTVLATEEKCISKAKVTYEESVETASEDNQLIETILHPVVGKTYCVSRPGEKLVVTDLNGQQPGPEELKIVLQSMDAIGRQNPWARFFHHRSMVRGETVQLPQHLANDLLGFTESLGKVLCFKMTLREVREIQGIPCAVLDARIDMDSPVEQGVSVSITGWFFIALETCRTLAVDLECPVSMQEMRGPQGGKYTVSAEGSLHISMRAKPELPLASLSVGNR